MRHEPIWGGGKEAMHYWHDIQPFPKKRSLRAVIEISQGTRQKFALDPELGVLTLGRRLLTACRYPVNYGFIPQTVGLDGDPADILVFSQEPLIPLLVVAVRPIGVFDLITDGEKDHKIIAVTEDDPEFGEVRRVSDIPKFRIAELKQFLQTYKSLENEKATLTPFRGSERAWQVILQSYRAYGRSRQRHRSSAGIA